MAKRRRMGQRAIPSGISRHSYHPGEQTVKNKKLDYRVEYYRTLPSKAWSAYVVTATRPHPTRLTGPPVVDICAGGTCEPADRLMVRASSCAAALRPSPDRRENRTRGSRSNGTKNDSPLVNGQAVGKNEGLRPRILWTQLPDNFYS